MQKKLFSSLKIVTGALLFFLIGFIFFSFTLHNRTTDFLKELGITKEGAEEKITQSILSGSFDIYGLKNVKNIALGNREAIVKDVFIYARQFVNSEAFAKHYKEMCSNYKPEFTRLQTPDEMQQQSVALYRKAVADTEESYRKADAALKPVFENVLKETKKQLAEAENPSNRYFVTYKKNYEAAVKQNQENYERQLAEWERMYPPNHLLYVKKRLQEFLQETAEIDFAAELTMKNGKKLFVNPVYEAKGSRWKMAFRAGKGVVTTARTFVKQWISEIN